MTLGRETRRSGPPRRRAALALALLLVAWSVGAARAEEPPRVLLVAPAEAELTARILGQTRDLGITLEVEPAEPPRDANAASALGRGRAAEIVVFCQPRGAAGLDVYLLAVASGEVRTRRVSTPQQEALASSTTAEMAALVVRSELSALLAVLKAAPPPAAPEQPAPSRAPIRAAVEPEQPEPSRAASGPWTAALAYRPSRPLHGVFGHGFSLGARRDLGGFALGLSAIGTLPITLASAGTEIRLTRLALRLEGLKRWWVSPNVSLLLGVGAALTLDFRSTEQVEASMMATPDATTVTGGFGPQGQLEWMFSSHAGATLGVGADLVPWRTEFVYDDGAGGGRVARLSWLDLWVLVGFFTRFGA